MSDPTRTRERRRTIAVCAGVTLLATLLAFWWSTTNRYRLTGDEPHFLILAASLLRDGDCRRPQQLRRRCRQRVRSTVGCRSVGVDT